MTARYTVRSALTAMILLLVAALPCVAQNPDPDPSPPDRADYRLDSLRVKVTRLDAEGVPLARLPYGADVLSSSQLDQASGMTLADALDGLTGVSTASQFGSPAQPDLRLRGFQVGPVVGFPQSVSVFVDGVRVNEPDASQVNFDLIPTYLVERVEVIRAPGGPFGRNALAGSINLVTRRSDGGDVAGTVELKGGSFEHGEATGWASGGAGGMDWLVSGRYLTSEGWRDLSETRLRQAFAKIGYRCDRSDVWLSYTVADNRVQGPGSLPRSWLRGQLPPELADTPDPRRLQYTGFDGDAFSPHLHFAVLGATRRLGPATTVQGRAFLRSNRFQQFNDNITEPNVLGETDLLSAGGTLQVTRGFGGGATASAGVEYTRNDTDIRIYEVANPAFPDAGGMTESVASVEDQVGAFAHLWWGISDRVSLTGSLRYDYVDLPITDRLDPENSGENSFGEMSGSLGADLQLAGGLRAFASYGRGFRVPVILEISCADPEDPCPLPFELGADPPLDPVTTDTWQAGVRYVAGPSFAAELLAYHAEVYDDLFAVVAPPSTRGYFRNLDRTRRQGLELSAVAIPDQDLKVEAGLGLTRATFETSATLASALLADDDDEGEAGGDTAAPEDPGGDGAVQVEPGDRFAMVPDLTARLAGEWRPGPWTLGLETSYVGSQYFVGDEWNRAEYGRLSDYLTVEGRLERRVGALTVFLVGLNLLDSDHHTFGLISPNVRGPDTAPQPFLTPAPPRRARAGVRYSF